MNAERIHCCSFTFGETCTSFASYVIHFFEHEHAFHIVLRTLLFNFFAGFPALVGLSGLEPPTSRLSGVRSNRLSYKPISWIRGGCPAPCTLILLDISVLVEMNGIEPMTPCLQSRCSPSWATPPYSIEHRASLFCCSAHSVSSWKLFHFLFTFLHEKKVKFGLPNFQCAYFLCTIGPSKLNNTNNSNFVLPDLGC